MREFLEKVRQAIIEGEDDSALTATQAALEAGVTPLDILNQAIVPGIEEAGRLWNENTYFLPEVILSAGAFNAALKIVEPHLAS